MQLKRNQMFCVMLHQDARTALTETCHGTGTVYSGSPFNQQRCLCYMHSTRWEEGHVQGFVIDYPVTYARLTAPFCLFFLMWKKVVPQKRSQTPDNPGSVCLPQKNNFIRARRAYPKEKQLAPGIRRLKEVPQWIMRSSGGKHKIRG